jgi:hypothetical protein
MVCCMGVIHGHMVHYFIHTVFFWARATALLRPARISKVGAALGTRTTRTREKLDMIGRCSSRALIWPAKKD